MLLIILNINCWSQICILYCEYLKFFNSRSTIVLHFFVNWTENDSDSKKATNWYWKNVHHMNRDLFICCMPSKNMHSIVWLNSSEKVCSSLTNDIVDLLCKYIRFRNHNSHVRTKQRNKCSVINISFTPLVFQTKNKKKKQKKHIAIEIEIPKYSNKLEWN